MDMIRMDDERPWLRKGAALGMFAGMTAGAAWLGSMTMSRSSDRWYDGLDKPWFTPPKAVFGPVWTGLYALIALSGYRVWRTPRSRRRRTALGLWATQLVLNAAWTPLFFGLRRPMAALVDLAALAGTTTAYVAVARKLDRPAAMMMLPYLGWLGLAGALNEEIWRLNRK
jgi:tryptophan-rich sensory protein